MTTQTEALKLVPTEPTNNMKAAASQLFAKNPKATPSDFYKVMVATAKEALAQPEQEPVAWFRNEDIFGDQEMEPVFYATKAWDDCQPLYTTPPQRTWVGLDEEDDIDWEEGGSLRDLVEAVEAKLRSKNGY